MATIRRVTIATTLVMAVLLSAPGHSTADPVGSALGQVAPGLLDDSGAQTPSVTVGGGGLPQISVGGGDQSVTPPAPAATPNQPQPASGSPTSSPAGSQPGVATDNTSTRIAASRQRISSGATKRGRTLTGGERTLLQARSARPRPSRSAGPRPRSARTGKSAKDRAGRLRSAVPNPRPCRAWSARSRLISGSSSSGWNCRGALPAVALHDIRRSRRAQDDALADPLTGLTNRAGFEQRLAKEWARAKRYERGLGLLLIDLDDFKQVNDTEGHMPGDRRRDGQPPSADASGETDLAADWEATSSWSYVPRPPTRDSRRSRSGSRELWRNTASMPAPATPSASLSTTSPAS